MPALFILLPLAAVLLLNLPLGRLLNRAAFAVGLLVCVLQLDAAWFVPDGAWIQALTPLNRLFGGLAPVDSLSRITLLSIGLVGATALMVARQTMRTPENLFRFVNLALLAVAGMNGMALAGDLFSLYVFLEVTAVAAFILIAMGGDRDAFEGTFKYIVLSAAASALILAAVALLFLTVGSVSFAALQAALPALKRDPVAVAALVLLLTGLFIKSGVVPFHGWLPGAYTAAPAPTSVLLAGIVTKLTGVYILIRAVTNVFQVEGATHSLLLVFGTVSILVGAFAALGQRDFKRMLAYSSISQVGYIVIGLGAGTPLGLAGAMLHFFNHAVFKSLLFVNAAAVEEQTGTRDLDRLGGLAQRMPVTGTTSVVAFLSTAGIPPLAGFWSKLLIVVALWQAGHAGYAALAVLASLVTLAYFLSMQRRAFFGQVAQGFEQLREAGPWLLIPAVLLAIVTIGVGVGAPWLFETFLLPIGSIL
jgi:multicomponent Na+:H+ antiporter subunit D